MVGSAAGCIVLAGVASVAGPALVASAGTIAESVGTVGLMSTAQTVGGAIGTTSAGIPSMSAAFAAGQAAVAPLIAAGPAGWLLLGTELKPVSAGHQYTYDCWKPILHDSSSEPSQGVLLKEVLLDPRIKHVEASFFEGHLPEIVLRNVWEEEYQIQYVMLPHDQLAAHAVRLQHAETIQ